MLDDGRRAGAKRAGLKSLASALALCATIALGAGPASASCGGVSTAKPEKDRPGRAPIAIGDSPMLLAVPNLAHIGYRPNARGCRQYPEGLRVLRDYKHRHPLPKLVVIALGSNGTIERSYIHKALDIVGRRTKLGLVTPRELGGGSSSDATVVRRENKHHDKRIRLIDWVRFSHGHSSWFQPDGLHLTSIGARAFTGLLKKPLLRHPHR